MRMQEQPGRDAAPRAVAPAGPVRIPARTTAGPGAAADRTPADVMALQRSAGNDAVVRMLNQERHAHGAGCGHDSVQRRMAAEAAPVQQHVSPLDVVSRPGRSLERSVADEVEWRTGKRPPEGLQIHTDAAAHDSAVGINAEAYTSGKHIAFQRDAYQPHTPEGMERLIHEVKHAEDQSAGPVPGTDMGDGTRMSTPGDSGEVSAVQYARSAMVDPVGASQPAG